MKRIIICCLICFASHYLLAQEGKQLYKTYCAGCHGARLQGNSATKLIKTSWIYGRGRGAMFRNIKFGIPNAEMPAWHTVLNDDQINGVVDFIVAAQKTPPDAVRPLPENVKTEDYTLKVDKVVTAGIETPWGIEFVDARHALITENKGAIRWMVDGVLDPTPVQGLPVTDTRATGGYMDIALDPAYADNGWVYLAYSQYKNNQTEEDVPAMTKIVRGKIKDHQWKNQQTLFEVPDSLLVVKGNRWGCRMLFDKAGYLYFTIGDMAQAEASQDVGKAQGKVYRINPDGSIPKDNPYAGQKGALQAIYTIGNRNVEGIDQSPVTGEIWATEHGPMGGDELNVLKKGANYGWPVITFGIDYSGEIVSEKTAQAGMEQPITYWTPSIAVCPIEFSTSPLFPDWKNNLLVGALAFEELRRLVIEGDKVVKQEMILKDYGRVRDIKTSPDGAVYVLLNKPDMVIRITPQREQ